MTTICKTFYVSTGIFPRNDYHSLVTVDQQRGVPLFVCEEQVDTMMGSGIYPLTKADLIHNFSLPFENMCIKTQTEFDWAVTHIDEIIVDMLRHGWIKDVNRLTVIKLQFTKHFLKCM